MITDIHRLFDHLSGVLYRCIVKPDGSTEFEYVSKGVEQIYGVTQSEVIENPAILLKNINLEDYKHLEMSKQKSKATLKPFSSEFRINYPEGEVHWLQLHSLPTAMNDGSIAFDGFLVDITDRKNHEFELELAQSRLQSIATNAPLVLFQYQVDDLGVYEISYISGQCLEVFGYSPEIIRKKPQFYFDDIHQHHYDHLIAQLAESAKSMEPFNTEYRLTKSSGNNMWVQEFVKPSKTADGNIIWEGFLIDITKRKNTEIALEKTLQELEAATRMKDDFLARMSHELRTPLNAILSTVDGMQAGVFDPVTEQQGEGLDTVKKSGSYLLELINDILDLAKIESGKVGFNRSSVDLKTIWERALAMATPYAEKKKVRLSVDVPVNVDPFEADGRRLTQILSNLLSNAIKFTPTNGKVCLTIELVSRDGKEEILFNVKDTGIGISAEHIESVFEPFFQVDSSLSRNYEGTGLGLSLVKQYAELQHGSVSVSSELGKGSTFTVNIPYKKSRIEKPCKSVLTAVPSPELSASADKVKYSLLLVDDNEAATLATRKYLVNQGYDVAYARSGFEAIEIAPRIGPDLIMMDIQMPGMDGLEAIKQIKNIESTANIPIIAITGLVMQGDEKRCLEAGANQYLSKPYSIFVLKDIIDSLLTKKFKADSKITYATEQRV